MSLRNKSGFTLVEILIAVSIFAVISIGVFTLTRSFGKGASESLKATSSQQDIAQAFITMRKELYWSRDIFFPPLKIHSDRLEFRSRDQRIQYRFEKGVLRKSSNGKERNMIQGLRSFQFYRLDSKLLELKIETQKDTLLTRIYLENLGEFQ